MIPISLPEPDKERIPAWLYKDEAPSPFIDSVFAEFESPRDGGDNILLVTPENKQRRHQQKRARIQVNNAARTVLAAVSAPRGEHPRAAELIGEAVEFLLGVGTATTILPVRDNETVWFFVECSTTDERNTLVARRHAFRRRGPILVIFREINLQLKSRRVVTLIRVKEADIGRAKVAAHRAHAPQTHINLAENRIPYTTRKTRGKGSKDEVLFDLNVYIDGMTTTDLPRQSRVYTPSTNSPIGLSTSWAVKPSPPYCLICRGEDHTKDTCWWFGDLGDKGIGRAERFT